jgi:copper chaperone CopZ
MKSTKIILTLSLSIFCLTTLTAMKGAITKENHPSIAINLNEHNNTDSFKVYGNCGMCERTIEGSLKDLDGVKGADWNKETKMMQVTYDPHVISLKEIKQQIASVGYDTDEIRAKDKVYNKLPGCCQYERPNQIKDQHDHKH